MTVRMIKVLEENNRDVGPVKKRFMSWAEDHRIPKKVLNVFASGWIRSNGAGVGAMTLNNESDLMERSKDSERCFSSRLLLLGSCPNGDWIVVDLVGHVGAVGLVPHGRVWEQLDLDPRDEGLQIAPSIPAFVVGVEKDKLPTDFFEAKQEGCPPMKSWG